MISTAIGIAVAVVVLYVVYRIGGIMHSGCGEHHYGEWEPTGRYRVIPWHNENKRVNIERKETCSCEHGGCDKKKERWTYVREFVEVESFENAIADMPQESNE